MAGSHANRPYVANSLKVKGRVARIAHPQSIVLPRQHPHRRGQLIISPPKFNRPRRFHLAAWFSLGATRIALPPPRNPIAPLSHLARSGGPTPPRDARADDPRAPRPPRPAVAESPLLFPEPCSCSQHSFNRAALARRRFKEAAPRRARRNVPVVGTVRPCQCFNGARSKVLLEGVYEGRTSIDIDLQIDHAKSIPTLSRIAHPSRAFCRKLPEGKSVFAVLSDVADTEQLLRLIQPIPSP